MSYGKLRGKIREVFGTEKAFASAMGLDPSSVSAKLNNKTEWTRGQVFEACNILNIPLDEAADYFFCSKS